MMKPFGWLFQKYQAMAWLVIGQREAAGKVFEAMLQARPGQMMSMLWPAEPNWRYSGATKTWR